MLRCWSALRVLPLVVLLSALGVANAAQAKVSIDITQGNRDPLPIALPELAGQSPGDGEIGRQIMNVVTNDLERSGLFRPINRGAFIEKISFQTTIPRFGDWRQIDAQALVSGTVQQSGGGNVRVAFRLWDVYGEQQIAGKEFNTVASNWRRVAHLIADEIYKRLTGENGYFDSRIVYIAESGSATKRVKRLAIMDQDGFNHKYLTNGANLVLTPRFSPTFQEVIYLSFAGRAPKVHLRNLQTGQDDIVGNFDGMTFAPNFSADGRSIVMTYAKGGNSDVYLMDIRSRRQTRLTSDPAIDTSPCFSPDGRYITFNSDRGGQPQLYVMNSNGGGQKRISFGAGRYSTPVWSPRGDLIAFTKQQGGQFYIGVMRPDGTGERLLTNGYLVEGPTWSSNGRVIVFTRENSPGHPKLYSIDVTGFNERVIPTPSDASDPAWSPLLPM